MIFAAIESVEVGSHSRWARECHDWVMAIIHNGKAKVLASCGRYFDWCDEDLRILEDDEWGESSGIYIIEGGYVSDRDWETGIDEGGWEASKIRLLTDEEWERYRSEDEPWPIEFYAPDPPPDMTIAADVPNVSYINDCDGLRWMLGEDLMATCCAEQVLQGVADD